MSAARTRGRLVAAPGESDDACPIAGDTRSRRRGGGRMGDFDSDCSADRATVATTVVPTRKTRARSRKSAPAELLALVRSMSESEAAALLAVSRGTIYNIKRGYWPKDDRRMMAAWARYQGQDARHVGAWHMRRVHTGSTVRHAGHNWTARALRTRVGQQVVIARAADGDALIAQTITHPIARIILEPVA